MESRDHVASGPHLKSFEKEYREQEALFKIQPPIVQRFLEAQARQIADVFVQRGSRVHFSLPDRVVVETNGKSSTLAVPQNLREQSAGSLRDRLTRNDVHFTLRERLSQLEQSSERGGHQCTVDPPYDGHAYGI